MENFFFFQWVSIGLVTFAFLFTLALAIKNFEATINISFAAFSIFFLLNTILVLFRVGISELNEWVLVEKSQNVVLLLLAAAYIVFIENLTEYKAKKHQIFTFFLIAILIVFNIFSDYGFAYASIGSLTKDVDSGLMVPFDFQPSNAIYFFIFLLINVFVYVFLAARDLTLRDHSYYPKFLITVLAFSHLVILTDTLLFTVFEYNANYMLEISFFSFIFVMIERNVNHLSQTSRIKRELTLSEERYRTLVEQSPDLILILDDNKIVFANETASNMLVGGTPAHIYGKPFAAFLIDSNIQLPCNSYSYYIKESPLISYQLKRHDGEIIESEGSYSRVTFEGVEMCRLILRDITERHIMVRELYNAKEKAEKANSIKTTLLANSSHEFRTPLNGILGLAQILKMQSEQPDNQKIIDGILKSGIRLKTTLNSLLLMMDLQSDNYKVYPTITSLPTIFESIKERFTDLAKEKNIRFEVQCVCNDKFIVSDDFVLTNILIALLDNAFKYTSKGSVFLSFTRVYDSELNSDIYNFDIIDTGIGINQEYSDIIFEEFRQASEGLSRAYEGLGLGLTIAAKLAHLVKGSINFTSTVGKGTTFTFKLPVLEAPPLISGNGSVGRKYEILIIEDNLINAELLKIFLQDDYIVTITNSVDGARNLFRKKAFHCYLIDIDLGSGATGIDLLHEIQNKHGISNTLALAVTGYANNNNKREILSAGFNGYVVKPHNKSDLLQSISSLLN